jgi:hypothetical protein
MPRTEKPKVPIRHERTSLGWLYRIRTDGMLMAAAFSRETAKRSAPRMIAIYEQVRKRAVTKILVGPGIAQ